MKTKHPLSNPAVRLAMDRRQPEETRMQNIVKHAKAKKPKPKPGKPKPSKPTEDVPVTTKPKKRFPHG